MCTAHLDLLSPSGIPITVSVGPEDDAEAIIAGVERAEKIGLYLIARGWTLADSDALGSSIGALPQGPTFAGYPCSPTVDDHGLPTWIIVDGKQAQRREKQGDVWYSVKLTDGTYAQVLRIPKGEKPPDVKGL